MGPTATGVAAGPPVDIEEVLREAGLDEVAKARFRAALAAKSAPAAPTPATPADVPELRKVADLALSRYRFAQNEVGQAAEALRIHDEKRKRIEERGTTAQAQLEATGRAWVEANGALLKATGAEAPRKADRCGGEDPEGFASWAEDGSQEAAEIIRMQEELDAKRAAFHAERSKRRKKGGESDPQPGEGPDATPMDESHAGEAAGRPAAGEGAASGSGSAPAAAAPGAAATAAAAGAASRANQAAREAVPAGAPP